MAAIGIKLANGEFYPIMEEHTAVKKRLILTTVHDSQKSVQIDLYKSAARSMADALYIGSLVVENIHPKAKGEPSVELIIVSTPEGVITAESVEQGNLSTERQQLSLHLKSFEEDKQDYPDFEVDAVGETPNEEQQKKFPWALIITAGFALILLCLGLWFFLFRDRSRPETPLNKTEQAAPPVESAPAALDSTAGEESVPAEQSSPKAASTGTVQPDGANPGVSGPDGNARPAVIDTPPRASSPAPSRERQDAPVYSFKVPQTIPPEGISYTIRWGDTLWDIAEVFYRNPWLYPRIVRYNNMGNPNLIVSGTKITIPRVR
jgi:nucleoid-associated protein YgaU